MKQMSKEVRNAVILLVLFVLLIIGIKTIDVQAIGPQGTKIGFATVNNTVHQLFGVHEGLYELTDVLGKIALLTAAGFACLGLYQLITRKNLRKVDMDLYVLGCGYAAVILLYVFFEICVINYRPVILDEGLEASFPSSHTMVVLFIMITAVPQFRKRLKNRNVMIAVNCACLVIAAVTVIGRLVCGVHWFTDIVGGLLLGSAMILLHNAAQKDIADLQHSASK